MRLGPWEIALIVLVVVLLFGARRIPDLMRGLGQGVKEFKKGLREEDSPSESPRPGGNGKGNEQPRD